MKKNNNWYSVIVALLIIWFLLLLVVWIFNLVLKEYNDTRAMWNYYKSYYWAEAAQELALLDIKEYWYWIDSSIDFSVNDESIVLSDNPKDKSIFNKKMEVYIWYNLNTKTNVYSWTLESLEYDIIPLFYIDSNTLSEEKSWNIDFSITSWNDEDLVWNIVSSYWLGISWAWEFTWNSDVKMKNTNGSYIEKENILVKNFLDNNSTNYLILFNTSENNLSYSLESVNNNEFFTKPRTYIVSSAKIWDYKQNIRTYLNNTEYLNILKYSIHSN